jgi:hypothetical protein
MEYLSIKLEHVYLKSYNSLFLLGICFRFTFEISTLFYFLFWLIYLSTRLILELIVMIFFRFTLYWSFKRRDVATKSSRLFFKKKKLDVDLLGNNVFVVTSTSNMTTSWNLDEITPEFEELDKCQSKNQRIHSEEMNVTYLECDLITSN